ncbi:cytosolic protein [Bacillus sp. FJAT-42376]|uniref:cytosolic protein n=1 Tax=Bacillus sp. FJAT-42376 TaxID=2014076 RepID=UPI000F4EAB1E|nr:cytosolic protein [Bacillus sp. FJAT-42376]AZB43889.1 cytosolic protein [Bacillus sp. FJAT-42376]
MSLLKRVQAFFSAHSETSENHQNPDMRSRYYKTTAKKAIEAVQAAASSRGGCQVTSVSEERGEISVQVKKPKSALLVATVISVRPFETAIDFSVSSDTALPTDFGYSRKVISEFYNKLDSELKFVGSGLNSGK